MHRAIDASRVPNLAIFCASRTDDNPLDGLQVRDNALQDDEIRRDFWTGILRCSMTSYIILDTVLERRLGSSSILDAIVCSFSHMRLRISQGCILSMTRGADPAPSPHSDLNPR